MFDEHALFQVGAWLQKTGYRFVTITPATHARVNARREGREAKSLRDIFGWSMPFQPSLLPPSVLLWLQRGDGVEERAALLRSKVRFSTLGDSLYMHSSYPTTDPDAVFFGPDTYRFAALIQRTVGTLASERVDRVVDVGCGAGAGAIVAVKTLKEPPAQCILADINPAALDYARVNVALAGMRDARFLVGNLFEAVAEPIDLLVANPPYLLDPQARLYRHGGGELGSDLSTRIVVEGLPRLAAGGTLILYTGAPIVNGIDTFWHSVESLLRDTDAWYDYSEIDPDVFGDELEYPAYSQVERIAAVALVIRKSSPVARSFGRRGLLNHAG